MWSRMAAPVAGEGAEEVDDPPMLFIPVPVMRAPASMVLRMPLTKLAPLEPLVRLVRLSVPGNGTTTMEAVRVTRVVSGDWGLRMMAPSTMAGEVESSWWEVGMVAKASSVHSSLEETRSSWRSKEKSFLTGLPVAVLSTVRRLTKANVAVGSVDVGWVDVGSVTVFICLSSALAGLEFGLDWSMKCGRLVRMACWIATASVCTIEVIVLVKPCCLLASMVCVVVVECSICSVVTVEMTWSEAVVEMTSAMAEF